MAEVWARYLYGCFPRFSFSSQNNTGKEILDEDCKEHKINPHSSGPLMIYVWGSHIAFPPLLLLSLAEGSLLGSRFAQPSWQMPSFRAELARSLTAKKSPMSPEPSSFSRIWFRVEGKAWCTRHRADAVDRREADVSAGCLPQCGCVICFPWGLTGSCLCPVLR